jgi:hypothetical protein
MALREVLLGMGSYLGKLERLAGDMSKSGWDLPCRSVSKIWQEVSSTSLQVLSVPMRYASMLSSQMLVWCFGPIILLFFLHALRLSKTIEPSLCSGSPLCLQRYPRLCALRRQRIEEPQWTPYAGVNILEPTKGGLNRHPAWPLL